MGFESKCGLTVGFENKLIYVNNHIDLARPIRKAPVTTDWDNTKPNQTHNCCKLVYVQVKGTNAVYLYSGGNVEKNVSK